MIVYRLLVKYYFAVPLTDLKFTVLNHLLLLEYRLAEVVREVFDSLTFATEASEVDRKVAMNGCRLSGTEITQILDELLVAMISCPVQRSHLEALRLEIAVGTGLKKQLCTCCSIEYLILALL